MRLLLFSDVDSARKFMRRHRDKILQVIIVVNDDAKTRGWRGAVKSNYGAVVLSGLVILQES